MIRKFFFVLYALALFILPQTVNSQVMYGGRTCGSATSPAGSVIWDYDDIFELDMQYCDGTTWISLLTTTTATTCTAPEAGKLLWNAAGYFEYCNGVNLINTKGRQFAACANADLKKMRYENSVSSLQSCDGTNWYNMGPTTVIFNANGTYVVPSYATAIRISVWGGGGGGGQSQLGNPNPTPQQGANGTDGAASSVQIPTTIPVTLTANAGAFGRGGNDTIPGVGGLGGTAMGGDSNVTGGNGVTGQGGTSGTQIGGNGGAAFKGGKAGSQAGSKGVNGLAPGGGGAGENGTGGKRAGGGGGAGGYSVKLYTDTSLVGLTLTITVGAGGARAVAGSGNGGAGRVIITYW